MASNIANVSGLIGHYRSYEHIGVSLLQKKKKKKNKKTKPPSIGREIVANISVIAIAKHLPT